MSHFAKVVNGIVEQVIVADQSFVDSLPDGKLWLQTSYNTKGNKHYDPITNQPDNKKPFRGNYAGIGYIYDIENDVFYAPKPFDSWILSKDNWLWEAPIPMPIDENSYIWNEGSMSWQKTSKPV